MTSWSPKMAITGNRGSRKKPNKQRKRGGSPKTLENGQQNNQDKRSKKTNSKGNGKAQ